ncbi:hypothetical protein [Sphingopyxis sp. PET50]|uniref:hypothetical protein n=1 Tax=Sphingopyxis sp. PET50 TaxID=2976533 RepID=UPI0021AF348C|nr:hypothetical protein [Sphingopyxis sp. PET50]
MKIELPDATLRLCDGAFVKWDAETFTASDADFGAIGAMQSVEEGVGDELPALQMTFLPNSTAAAADLSQPEFQGCRVRMWIAEVDLETNEVSGAPSLEFDGQVDSTVLIIDVGSRELDMSIVPKAERLFLINEGNTLSPRFHKSLFVGELGEDNATGVGVGVAWGTALPAQTYGTGFSNGGVGNGGGGSRTWLDALR